MKRIVPVALLVLAVSGQGNAQSRASLDEQSLFKQFLAICDTTDADAALAESKARSVGFQKTPGAYAPKAVVPNIRQSNSLWKIFEDKVIILTTGRAPVAGIQVDADVCVLASTPGTQGDVAAFRRWAEVPGTTSPAGNSYFYRQSAGPHQSMAATNPAAIQSAVLAGETRVAFYASNDEHTTFILFRPKP